MTPIRKNKLRDLLASWAPLADALPKVEDPPPNRGIHCDARIALHAG
jgi:antitoxin VapB